MYYTGLFAIWFNIGIINIIAKAYTPITYGLVWLMLMIVLFGKALPEIQNKFKK